MRRFPERLTQESPVPRGPPDPLNDIRDRHRKGGKNVRQFVTWIGKQMPSQNGRWILSASLVEHPHIANNHERVLGPANRDVKHVRAYVESRRAVVDGRSGPGW